MRVASVCSGIGGCEITARRLGWRCVFVSEIQPFAGAVLERHYPHVPNVGDMLNIRGEDYDGKIDIIAGGTPCPSFSNAGKRKGLDDPRGKLTPAFAKLARDTRAPWLVWENVPGVLWCDRGKAFARILRMFTGRGLHVPPEGWKSAGIVTGAGGRYSVAWRVLDSQYTRVAGYERALPQLRRRLWLVGHRGDWAAPAEILIGPQAVPPVPRPVRLPEDTDSAPDAGSSRNPVSIAGNVISRDPANEFVRRQKGWRTGASFCLPAKQPCCICDGAGVRYMTPVEYERLMGFPDGYTDVPFRGRPASGHARRHALGNSWPLNCAQFVLGRIDRYVKGVL
ncbi:MAG: DNA cytosine methyltransferase [Kiritimatiellaeota bacterium]|nr:DNA cytosine methyltransferase [Kiritimatiellota bacterium]